VVWITKGLLCLVFSPNGEFRNLDTALRKNLICRACSEKKNRVLTASSVAVVMFSTVDIATLMFPASQEVSLRGNRFEMDATD
jgi:hypothetical protein